jgi:uncharacterized protein YlzI (FlbEa/FlbD family)
MLLICSAWEEEVRALNGQQSTVNGEHIKTLGIGYLEAALKLNNILRDANYSRIIFLGTAGAYSNELQIGDIVNVASVALLNPLTIEGKGYVPREYNLYESSRVNGQGSTVNANCLSSLEITTNEVISKTIIENSPFTVHQLPLTENLELYGVAKVASEHNIPWSAFLGITNYTNVNAHQDWKANHERVSEKLCESLDLYKYKSLT